MTARGPEIADTPIAGLVELALRAPTLQRLTDFADERPAELALVGPASARLFVACALARGGPLLVVTATGREADDLCAELRGVLGDAVAMFPSWGTLPARGDAAPRVAFSRRRPRGRADDAAAPAGSPPRQPAWPAAAGGGHRSPLAAAADGVGVGPAGAAHPARRGRGGIRRRHRAVGRAGLHPGGHGRSTRRIRGPRRHSRHLRTDRRTPGPGGVLG